MNSNIILTLLYTLCFTIFSVICQDCSIFPERPLGMTDQYNGIKDEQIKSTSIYSKDTSHIYARLHYSDAFLWDPYLPGSGAWVARTQDIKQYVQVDLLERKVISSIGTQGRQGAREYVRDYYVEYSDGGDNPDYWLLYRDSYGKPLLFEGNFDDNTVKINNMSYPIVARHIRIKPQRWNKIIALRFELFGCQYKPWTATFDGQSRIDLSLDLPGRAVQTASDKVKFRFKTRATNGVILYSDGGQGDHFIVELYRTQLRIKVNLGYLSSTSPEKMDNILEAGSMLDDDQWHDVEIIRHQKDVNITLDRVKMWRNITADFMHLNLNRKISVGGVGNFAGKRALSVYENFKGCIEEMVFDGVHIIRDARRQQQLSINGNKPWQEVLYYPQMSPIIWWGDLLLESQVDLSNFEMFGTIGSTCPLPVSLSNVVTFPSIDSTEVKIRVERDGLTFLQFNVNFRTFNKDGTLFYYNDDAQHNNYIYVGLNKDNGHIQFEMILPGVERIEYQAKNKDPTSSETSFSDGLWHSLKLSVDKNSVILTLDSSEYKTIQLFTQSLKFQKIYYIGGGKPAINSFQGCMSNILLNNAPIIYNTNQFDASITNGSCTIFDRCKPNPCKHEAPCTQNGRSFTCDCSNTGYSGAVCHISVYPTSCSELSLRVLNSDLQERIIDLDGSGVLPPIKVKCDFRDRNNVVTQLHHNQMDKEILVEGHENPGSFRLELDYGTNRPALNELTRRASSCQQSITYSCVKSRLLESVIVGQVTRYNRTYGWWVGRRGQPLYYWGGSIPGLQMCECGVTGTCTGDSQICNCDGKTNGADTGLLTDKNDLPVMEVRLGDTATVAADKYGKIDVGYLSCIGDSLLDNTVTFTKPDSVIYLDPLFSENEFDMIFLFRTTIVNAIIMQCVGKSTGHFFEVRISEGNSLRVAFDVGQGVQILEIRSSNWLNDNAWHKIQFERNRKESQLFVDENVPISHEEDPDRPYEPFNFDQKLYVGSSQAFTDGYLGCFSNLIINGRVMDLKAAITDMYGIKPGCKPRCDEKPCLNRGECYELYSHYLCECGLTPYRGFVCGREVGATFLDGAAVRVRLDLGLDLISTMEEYIEIGFKTKGKQGTLMQISNDDNSEYITIKVNNNGGILIEFDLGFKRQQITSDNSEDLSTDQHHTLKIWRSKLGRLFHIQVDDYNIQKKQFLTGVAEKSDTRLDRPKWIYIGRNFSESPTDGFVGCIYRMQYNNIFPLKMVFNNELHKYADSSERVTILAGGQNDKGILENQCGFEEIMPKPEPFEFKTYPKVPRLPQAETMPDWQRQAIIVGVVLAIIFLVLLLLLVLFLRNYTVQRGDYDTREAKGADQMDTADNAIRYGRTGQPDVARKEWWI